MALPTKRQHPAAMLDAVLEFEAMSLAMPSTPGHPNKMPFSGILTRLDEPSDAPPHGSGGKRVLLTTEAATAALAGLLGMAVDFTPNFDGHDAQKKIGIIDQADIQGNALHISGFVWGADFPLAAAQIKRDKAILGFSYEMKNVRVADASADVLVITHCDFTGAAILRKDDAAYHTTSLAASKDAATGELDMTKEELEAIFGPMLAKAMEPVTAKIATIEAAQVETNKTLAASKEAQAKVQPHADAMRACAAGMQAAGIGGHPSMGHVARLNKMADQMEASAAMGNLPHIYRDHDFLVDASVDKDGKPIVAQTEVKPDPVVAELTAQLAAMGTKLDDLKAKAFTTAPEPERKTLSSGVVALLAKNDFQIDAAGEKKVGVAQFDTFLDKANVSSVEAIRLKLEARNAGLIG